ncbi:hypothetical protein [Stackebrandtia nassauensis]|uniref:Uncharacterized protein n=1 Tax=Stackebrandtia nassauensis (strain DSM 44728 / CIP 108903 / NRRL B-16338 / NBRC 102104 / LLR-40K-21) TaxID=446470 RepID=D3Q0M4_STANL|nr:hypothetical protein [Stackebrandtia nassauensis]ADD41760.1 hypothetical protein Snas_2066 [Stackebrandtia nassauensis DSM 44728]
MGSKKSEKSNVASAAHETGAASSGGGGTPTPPVLESATREIAKATLVPIQEKSDEPGRAPVKFGFLRQLGLSAAEADTLRDTRPDLDEPALDHAVRLGTESRGRAAEPKPSDLAALSVSALRSLGEATMGLRRERAESAATGAVETANDAWGRAATATQALALNTAQGPLGMLNLERLEMAPAGIERGELIATVPLAPLEETAVVQKEWSVQSKEFTSIVTDSLEEYSETGVTDNTELAQSTSSQTQHQNQFNVTGTVSGGIPVISGSASSGFTMQDQSSQSATDSRKHAKTLTQKASTRSQQEHKVTISTSTVTGSEVATTRKVRNPYDDRPIRIDYFSMMRKWRVRLYRYGLRLTYDITVPEPGATLRKTFRDLKLLRAQLKPFEFPVKRADITEFTYLDLADQYDAPVPDYPDEGPTVVANDPIPGLGEGNRGFRMPMQIPDGYEIETVTMAGRVTGIKGKGFVIGIVGSDFHREGEQDKQYDPFVVKDRSGGIFLKGQRGGQSITMYFADAVTATLEFRAKTKLTDDAEERWRTDVWDALFNAAQTRYYAQQQDIAAQIDALENQLASVDTLTLRREESDELMKAVIRFIAGQKYQYMSDKAGTAFYNASVDNEGYAQAQYGIGFVANNLKEKLTEAEFKDVVDHENTVRFINQAIEWENVVSLLYSYFWDTPDSWDFVRQIQHPDSTRQAFLRAGSARVILTVRKGFEEQWLRFAQSGFTDPNHKPDDYYLNIAREIAAYDSRNYPGIPPANPDRTSVRLQEAAYAASNMAVGPSPGPVVIKVDSTAGFVAGDDVVIDSVDNLNAKGEAIQEAQKLLSVNGPNQLTVAKLVHAHDGTKTPFGVLQPGAKGAMIAEWSEYTPTSGTDIAVSSNLGGIA